MKLFVGNLPLDITESDIQTIFSAYGEVLTSKLILDAFTGRSKGFAFVEMSTRSEGHKAMESLNGSEYRHRNLVCNEAKPLKKGRKRR